MKKNGFLKVGILFLMLIVIWYLFICLTNVFRIESISSLIMVWGSFFVIFFVLFPDILRNIKRVNIKGFEIELKEAVVSSKVEEYISIKDPEEYIYSNKGGFKDLSRIIIESKLNPGKPILLVVNLKNDDYVSIPMLFVYLFFLDLINSSIVVLFMSSDEYPRNFQSIRKGSIIGIVKGKTILQKLYKIYPKFSKIFMHIHDLQFNINNIINYDIDNFNNRLSHRKFNDICERLRDYEIDQQEYLSKTNVLRWFRNSINSRTINAFLDKTDIEIIYEALIQGDEYILVIESQYAKTVLSLSNISRSISKRILVNLLKNK